MIDFSERKDLLVVFILGILITIGLLIFSFIMIWKPDSSANEFKVGVVDTDKINITDEYRAHQYVERISAYFKDENYEELYKLLAKDYIQYSKINTPELLKKKIADLKINGQELYIESMETKNYNTVGDVLVLNVRGKDNDKAANIVIHEKSPRQFEFAFDSFIFYKDNLSQKSAENVKLAINSMLYVGNRVSLNVSITNNSSNTIVLNSGSYSNSCFVLNYSSSYLNSKSVITNDKLNIVPGKTVNYDLIFDISSTELRAIKGITLKNVKLTNDKVTDIYFEFEQN